MEGKTFLDRSPELSKLITALSKFQETQKPIAKNSQNPFLKNKYADLDGIIEGVRENMAKNGLTFVQIVSDDGVNTFLYHNSGEYISSGFKKMEVEITKGLNKAQAEGVVISYTKRYQLAALLGISTEEETDGSVPQPKQATKQAKPATGNNTQKAKVKPLEAEKVTIKKDSVEFTKAVQYLQTPAGKISDIKKKYILTSEIEELLLEKAME